MSHPSTTLSTYLRCVKSIGNTTHPVQSNVLLHCRQSTVPIKHRMWCSKRISIDIYNNQESRKRRVQSLLVTLFIRSAWHLIGWRVVNHPATRHSIIIVFYCCDGTRVRKDQKWVNLCLSHNCIPSCKSPSLALILPRESLSTLVESLGRWWRGRHTRWGVGLGSDLF